jgi:hypothetical protein
VADGGHIGWKQKKDTQQALVSPACIIIAQKLSSKVNNTNPSCRFLLQLQSLRAMSKEATL